MVKKLNYLTFRAQGEPKRDRSKFLSQSGGCRYNFPVTIAIMAPRKCVLDNGETDSSAGRSDDDNIDFYNDPDLKDERELF